MPARWRIREYNAGMDIKSPMVFRLVSPACAFESPHLERDNHLKLPTIFLGGEAANSAASVAEWKSDLGCIGELSVATKMAISVGSHSHTAIALLLHPVLVRSSGGSCPTRCFC